MNDGFVRSPYLTEQERGQGSAWCGPVLVVLVVGFDLLLISAGVSDGKLAGGLCMATPVTVIGLWIASRYRRSSSLPVAPFVLLFDRHPVGRGPQRARLAWTGPVREARAIRVVLVRTEEVWTQADANAHDREESRRRREAAELGRIANRHDRQKARKARAAAGSRVDNARVGETKVHERVIVELTGDVARDPAAPFDLVVPPQAHATGLTLHQTFALRVEVEFADPAQAPAVETWEVDVICEPKAAT